jgi:hypothetical protein
VCEDLITRAVGDPVASGSIVRSQHNPTSTTPSHNNGGQQLVATLERFQGFQPPSSPSNNASRFNIRRILVPFGLLCKVLSHYSTTVWLQRRDQGEAAIQRDLREMLHDLPRAVTQYVGAFIGPPASTSSNSILTPPCFREDAIPSLDRLVERAEADGTVCVDGGLIHSYVWGYVTDKAPLKIMLEMIKMLPLRNPIGIGLATVLMELLPNPSMVSLSKISSYTYLYGCWVADLGLSKQSELSDWTDSLATCLEQV